MLCIGGVNTDWAGTPLQSLYDKHVLAGRNDKDAHEEAGKDGGWLLKKNYCKILELLKEMILKGFDVIFGYPLSNYIYGFYSKM